MCDSFGSIWRANISIGADEYSSETITRKPLTANDVGPFAEETITSVESSSNSKINSDAFILYQNYPNPFNPSTVISWQLPVSSWQTLKIYNLLGNEVATLVNEYKPTSNYEVTWNASNLSSGLYFYRIQAGNPESSSGQVFIQTKKMVLLK